MNGLIRRCWSQDPSSRFDHILGEFQACEKHFAIFRGAVCEAIRARKRIRQPTGVLESDETMTKLNV
jgi:hypothetical protein